MYKKRRKNIPFCFLSAKEAEGGGQSLADMSAKKSSFLLTPSLANKRGLNMKKEGETKEVD